MEFWRKHVRFESNHKFADVYNVYNLNRYFCNVNHSHYYLLYAFVNIPIKFFSKAHCDTFPEGKIAQSFLSLFLHFSRSLV